MLVAQILAAESDKSEAQQVCETIKEMMNSKGYQPQDFAILFRNHSQGRLVEQAMVSFIQALA